MILLRPEAHAGHKLFLSGAEAVSMADLADVLSRELGRPVRHRELSLEQARLRWQARGTSAAVVDGLLAFAAYQRAGGAAVVVSDAVRSALRRPARTVREFVHDYADHFR